MTGLIYALIIIMVVDAFLLTYFIIRYVQKKRLEKEKGITKRHSKKENVNSDAKQKEKAEDVKGVEKTKKAKMTKHSSFGKIKVNEEALKKIFDAYDKDKAKDTPSNENTTDESVNSQENAIESDVQEAEFEDFTLEEKVEKTQPAQSIQTTQPRFRSPFRNLNERRNIFRREEKKEQKVDDDDDFDMDDIEKAYQEFLNRKKQEYLNKYEEDLSIEDLDNHEKDNHEKDNHEKDKPKEKELMSEPFSDIHNKPHNVEKDETQGEEQPKEQDAEKDESQVKEEDKTYTLQDFKEDYFNKHIEISKIIDKLSTEDKNKILTILLTKQTIDESDFE